MSTITENPVGPSTVAEDSQTEGQYSFNFEYIQVTIGASDNQGPAESRTEDDQLVYPHFRPAIRATSTETGSLELSETSLIGRKVVYTETGTLALEDIGNSYKFPNLSTEAESLSGGLLTPVAQNTVSSLQYDGGTDYFPSILPLEIGSQSVEIKSVSRDTILDLELGLTWNDGVGTIRSDDGKTVYPYFRPVIEAVFSDTVSLELAAKPIEGYLFDQWQDAKEFTGGILGPVATNAVTELQFDGGTDYFPSILPLTIRGETISIKSVGRDTTGSLELDVNWNDGEGTVRSDDGKIVYPYFRPTIEAEFVETASLEIALTPIEGYLFDQWYDAKEDTGGLLGPISMNSITEIQFDGGTDYFPSILPLTWQADESMSVILNSIDSGSLDIGVTDNDDGSGGTLRQDGKIEYPWFRPALELEVEPITFKSLAAFSEHYKFAATLGYDDEAFTPVGVISNTSITELGKMASLNDPRDLYSYAQLQVVIEDDVFAGRIYEFLDETAPIEIDATDVFSRAYVPTLTDGPGVLETTGIAVFENVFNFTDSATFIKLSVIDEDIIYNIVDTTSLEVEAAADVANIYSFTDITSLGVLSAVDVEVTYSFTNVPFNTFRATDQVEVTYNVSTPAILELDDQNVQEVTLVRDSDAELVIDGISAGFAYTLFKQINEKPAPNLVIEVDGDGEYVAYRPPVTVSQVDDTPSLTIKGSSEDIVPSQQPITTTLVDVTTNISLGAVGDVEHIKIDLVEVDNTARLRLAATDTVQNTQIDINVISDTAALFISGNDQVAYTKTNITELDETIELGITGEGEVSISQNIRTVEVQDIMGLTVKVRSAETVPVVPTGVVFEVDSVTGFTINSVTAESLPGLGRRYEFDNSTGFTIKANVNEIVPTPAPTGIVFATDSIASFTLNANVNETTPAAATGQINTLLVDDTVRFSFNALDTTNYIIDLPGVGANFTITSSGGTYSIDSINNLGINYELGDLITILGSDLGGFDGINDLILTVTGINAFSGITSVSLSGVAVDGTESYSQVTTTASTSNGSGDSWNISYENNVYNININFGGINYQAGDTIIIEGDTIYVDNTQTIVGGDVNNIIVYVTEVDDTGAIVNYTTSGPTAGSTPVAPTTQNVYVNPTYVVNGGSSGSGLVIQNVSTSGTSYSNITIDPTSLGTGFVQGDTITISGSQLGGLDITHDLTITITGIDLNGGVTSYTLTGTAFDSNTQSSVTTTNVTGTGTGATFDISVVDNEYNININGLGTGYYLGDTIVIPGGIDVVGGPANDITIQVTGVDANGGITSYSVQGTPYTGGGTFDASEGVYAVQDLQAAIGKQVFFN